MTSQPRITYSVLAKTVSHIKNPNKRAGTLIEEIPSDIGRSVEGYKRGGLIEGAEKLRKEVFSALVWLFGIPCFKWTLDKASEKILNIPMKIDFSQAKEGNDAIGDSVKFLLTGANPKNLDTTELARTYGDKFRLKPSIPKAPFVSTKAKGRSFKLASSETISKYAGKKLKAGYTNEEVAKKAGEIISKIKGAKKITSITAVALNCALMGIALPKINQAITNNKIAKIKEKEANEQKTTTLLKFETFEKFKNSTKSEQTDTLFSFKGKMPKDLSEFTYNVENDNVFRLIITDIPMIIGRVLTSRNKFEALEYLIMDGAGIYLYNYAADHVQRIIRKFLPNPDINPLIAEEISKQKPELIQKAIERIKAEAKKTSDIFQEDKDITRRIYEHGTFGKYGKINKFVKNSDIESIDETVVAYLRHINETTGGIIPSKEKLMEIAGRVNRTNAIYLGIGLAASTLGLAVGIPKFAFWVTKKLTGKNEFSGLADYSKKEDKKDIKEQK